MSLFGYAVRKRYSIVLEERFELIRLSGVEPCDFVELSFPVDGTETKVS